MEKRFEFVTRLKHVDVLLRELVDDDDVLRSTALYAFLLDASSAVSMAVSHVVELIDYDYAGNKD